MASGGLRAAYLSASTEADAGYKASNTHFPRHWLYAMLAVVVCPDRSSRVQDNKVL